MKIIHVLAALLLASSLAAPTEAQEDLAQRYLWYLEVGREATLFLPIEHCRVVIRS